MRPWLAFAALVGGYAAVLQAARWAVEQEVRTLRQLHAAQRLGTSRRALRERLKRLGLYTSD